MILTLKDVEHIAHLARLSLSAEEKDRFRAQLSAILDYAAILNRLDASTTPPTATVLPLRNVMREDTITPSLPAEAVLANAPDQAQSMFRVHAILEWVPQ